MYTKALKSSSIAARNRSETSGITFLSKVINIAIPYIGIMIAVQNANQKPFKPNPINRCRKGIALKDMVTPSSDRETVTLDAPSLAFAIPAAFFCSFNCFWVCFFLSCSLTASSISIF